MSDLMEARLDGIEQSLDNMLAEIKQNGAYLHDIERSLALIAKALVSLAIEHGCDPPGYFK